MLQQGLFSGDWGPLGAGILSLSITALGAFLYFLMTQGAFGVKTLLPGDHAYRTCLGRPVWYHNKPKSLFYIGSVFEVHIVTTRKIVHDSFSMDLSVGGEKRNFRVWLETEVIQDRESVTKAIFALGDAVNSHQMGNKRTLRVERLVRVALTEHALSVTSWTEFDPSVVRIPVSQVIEEDNGTLLSSLGVSDLVPTEGQVIAVSVKAALVAIAQSSVADAA